MKNVSVLMCCSALSVKGGMVSVMKNYLDCNNWGKYKIKFVPTHIERNKMREAVYFLFAYVRIVFAAMLGKYDIAYLHTAERGSFFRKAILVRTLRRFGIKTVMHHHAAEFEKFYDSLSDAKKSFVNKTLRLVDLNIVLSRKSEEMILSRESHARVKVLYNAVKTNESNSYSLKARGILFLGRLGQRKGVYDLLRAIKILDREMPEDIKLYLCGDGESVKVLQMAKEMNLERRIAYTGWVSGDKKTEIMKKCMMNVLPSYNEGLPMSILETMSLGIPNISTDIASIPEVIEDGVNGYLIRPGDIKALAEDIKKMYESETDRKSMSVKSHKLITENFSMERHIEVLKYYLDGICQGNQRSSLMTALTEMNAERENR